MFRIFKFVGDLFFSCLAEEDMKDILKAMDKREKGNYYKSEEVFE